MSETETYRIIFHTQDERSKFEEVKNIVIIVVGKDRVITLEPDDNGKKAIFFAATLAQKKRIETLLQNTALKATISSPTVPC